MDVTVIGCGYVGLVTGTCLASIGHQVRGVEKDVKKLKTLQDGHCPIFEPGLQELMQEHYASGQLQFTDNVKAAVRDAEVVFLCVGTPPKPDGTVDMSYLESAGKEVCDALAELKNEYMVPTSRTSARASAATAASARRSSGPAAATGAPASRRTSPPWSTSPRPSGTRACSSTPSRRSTRTRRSGSPRRSSRSSADRSRA